MQDCSFSLFISKNALIYARLQQIYASFTDLKVLSEDASFLNPFHLHLSYLFIQSYTKLRSPLVFGHRRLVIFIVVPKLYLSSLLVTVIIYFL